ncbi:MAG TPA: AAA family ATPase [Steroidobacteraceae bacterium]|nr:AAA family ATPase [Steroidobacteraceae bacterium]
MLDPATYPHAAPAPVLIETHVSWIALAGDYAYKLKRPVRFPFLDYSSVELRRAACDTEVRLNRRWAPALYLGVAELAATPLGPRFDAAGTPLEPAVRMRRFDRSQELDALVGREDVAADELAALGHALAGWQGEAQAVDASSPWGTAADVYAAIEENLETLRGAAPALTAATVAAVGAWIAREHAALTPELGARRAAGRVRECHGDLHTRNVVRLGGRLTPFDGIEFAARLRFIDVASDAAFLAMDLDRLGRPDLAAAFVDAWLAASGDYAAARVWRLFLCYRALVRAKIDALRALQLGTGPAADGAWAESRRFLATAERAAMRPVGRIVITHGPSGAGKSHVAAALVTTLPAVRLRADVERKRLAGLAPGAASNSAIDQGLYAPAMTERTYARLIDAGVALARAGLDVILDATFLDAAERARAAAAAAAAGAPFAILDCRAPEALLRERVAARRGDASEATPTVLAHQLATLAPLTAGEARRAVAVDAAATLDPVALAALLRAAAGPPGGSPRAAAPGS